MNLSIKIGARSDFQVKCLEASEDIILLGGAAGASKTTVLFLDTIRNTRKCVNMVFFRRHAKDVVQPGGLWDEASKWYQHLPHKSNQLKKRYTFSSGATITFMHADRLDLVKDDFRGAQIDVLYFDEVTELDKEVFWFLQSRNRPSSDHGMKPYTMMTCNPEDNWVKEMIDPYLDSYGYPIKELCNQPGYVYKVGDDCQTFVSEEAALSENIDPRHCFSFRFIPGTLNDNPVLLERDPFYFKRLATVPEYYRKAMVEGCWKFPARVKMFKPDLFPKMPIESFPKLYDHMICTTDLAIKKGRHNDYTVFSVWGLSGERAYLVNLYRGKWGFEEQKSMLETILENFDSLESIYVEDAIHGSAFVESFKKSASHFGSIPIKLVHRSTSKFERACESLPFLEKTGVIIPDNQVGTLFLQEVLNYNGEESSNYVKDDICDTLFDACKTFSKILMRKNMTQLRVESQRIQPLMR